jgi:hypothetical protein
VYGGSGRDLLTGGDGNDLVASNEGNDLLSGTDAISRGINEVDTLQSGSGADRFVLAGGMPYYMLAAITRIMSASKITLSPAIAYFLERQGHLLSRLNELVVLASTSFPKMI